MKAVIDRVVQYPNRFKLTDVSTGAVLGTVDLDAVTGAVSVVGTKINKELFDSIASDIEARVKTSGGDVSQTSETFTASSVRNNLTSGETISVSMGKIYKWLNDLKALAFKDSLGKADVGLGNIDNTTDKDKPISTATQTALDKKQDTLVSGTNIKTINSTSILGSGDITIASTSYYTAGDNITITTDNKINANCVPLGTVYGTGAGNLAGGTGSVAGTSGQNYTKMTAYGASAKASGNYSTAIGSASTASGDFSTASGSGSAANGNYSTASGNFSTASGNYSTASGSISTASGSYSTASGYGSNANGYGSNASGYNSNSSGYGSTANGYGSNASGNFSTASGYNSKASGNGSTAIGSLYLSPNAFGSYNNIENSVTFDGKYNSTYPTVHPNAIIHFGYLSNIVIRNSDQTSTTANVADIHTAYANAKSLQYYFDQKQDTLVSGTNIKTINGSSVLGTGDLAISVTVPVSTLTDTETVDIPAVDMDYSIMATVTAPAGYFAGVATTSTSYENCTPNFGAIAQTRAMQDDGSTKVTVTCFVRAEETQSGTASLTLSLKVADIAS